MIQINLKAIENFFDETFVDLENSEVEHSIKKRIKRFLTAADHNIEGLIRSFQKDSKSGNSDAVTIKENIVTLKTLFYNSDIINYASSALEDLEVVENEFSDWNLSKNNITSLNKILRDLVNFYESRVER